MHATSVTMDTPRKRCLPDSCENINIAKLSKTDNLVPLQPFNLRKAKKLLLQNNKPLSATQPSTGASNDDSTTIKDRFTKQGSEIIPNDDQCRPTDVCVFCALGTLNDSIQCESCNHFFHLECCGVNVESFKQVSSVISLMGWTCVGCRIHLRAEMKMLRDELVSLRAKTQIIKVSTVSY